MKVLVQWTLNTPEDWIEIDSSLWANLPKLKEPTGNQTGDNNTKSGWIYDLCIQGLLCGGNDHYAVEELGDGSGGVRVTVWNDDPVDYPEGEKYARVLTILPLAPDSALGGAINTRFSQVVYGQPVVLNRIPPPARNTIHRPWSEFAPPPDVVTRHGIWVSDGLSDKHFTAQSQRRRSWRDWGEHLDPSELDTNGRVKVQRNLGRWKKALGTITYFQRDTDRATGVHATTHEDALETTTDTAATEQIVPAKDSDQLAWAFTTPVSEPNDADWPNGTYRCQLDVDSLGLDLNYGLLTVGESVGHFANVNSGLTADNESVAQSEPAFSGGDGPGLKLATVSWNPGAGATGDRFECLVAIQNTNLHMQLQLTIQLNTADSYADGPWTVGGDVTVTPDPAALVCGKVDPSVVLGSISLTPTPASLVTEKVDPTVISDVLITPDPATLVPNKVDPGVILGSIAYTPTPASLVADKVDPGVVLGSVAISPSPASLLAAGLDPSVILGGINITPQATSALAAGVDPAVVLGSLTLLPSPATLVTDKVDPNVITDVVVTPDPVYLLAASLDPSVILGSLSLTPTPISLVAGTVDPAVILGSLSVTPIPADLITAKVDPLVILGGLIISPTPASLIASKVDPSVIPGGLNLTPAAASLVVGTIDPTVLIPMVISPSSAALRADGIDPSVILGSLSITPSPAEAVVETIAPNVIIEWFYRKEVGLVYKTDPFGVKQQGPIAVIFKGQAFGVGYQGPIAVTYKDEPEDVN